LLEPKVIQPLKKSDGYVSEQDDFDYDALEAPDSPGRGSPPASPEPRATTPPPDLGDDADLDASESDLEDVSDADGEERTEEEKEAIRQRNAEKTQRTAKRDFLRAEREEAKRRRE
jgi:hypothetical protein